MRALNTVGSSLGVIIILKTLELTGPEILPSTLVMPFITALPPAAELKLAPATLLLFLRVTSIWVTFSSSLTGVTRVRSMMRKGMVSSCTRLPLLVRRVLMPMSLPSAIQPEDVIVSAERVMVFSATGMEEKGYWVTLPVWSAGT